MVAEIYSTIDVSFFNKHGITVLQQTDPVSQLYVLVESSLIFFWLNSRIYSKHQLCLGASFMLLSHSFVFVYI